MNTLKSTKILVAIFIVAAIFAGCDTLEFEEPDKTLDAPDYVTFQDGSASVSEAVGEDGLSVQINRSNADQSLTVVLSVESTFAGSEEDASDEFTVNPSNLEVTFAEDEYSTTFQIIPVNNDFSDGDKVVTVTIESVSSSDVVIGYPGPDQLNRSSDITIVDDDCPIDFAGWEGTYEVEEVFTSGTNEGLVLADAFGETYLLEISQDESDPTGFTYIINNADGANQYVPDGTTVVFNSCGGTLEFPQPLNIAVFADMTIQEATFNEANFSMTASGPLGNFGPYEFTFTKVVEE
jgi:hypothetical protein